MEFITTLGLYIPEEMRLVAKNKAAILVDGEDGKDLTRLERKLRFEELLSLWRFQQILQSL